MRLIDADALTEQIRCNASVPWARDKVMQFAFASFVDHFHTAYNADKVVKQIEILLEAAQEFSISKDCPWHCPKEGGCNECIKQRIIEIVRKGGKEIT